MATASVETLGNLSAARIGLGDEVVEVSKDDVLFIPAGTPHWYEALGDEPFEFLCVVPNGPDKIEIL